MSNKNGDNVSKCVSKSSFFHDSTLISNTIHNISTITSKIDIIIAEQTPEPYLPYTINTNKENIQILNDVPIMDTNILIDYDSETNDVINDLEN
mmetsp:Transcript_29721/g.36420  ORF Transcript_29721/g.36420 Transcript_29721/m.36420 type:complete len:94 (+) Transcript_29721:43-324(+)